MKKLLFFALIIALSVSLAGCKTQGKNAVNISMTPSTVYFYPKCPYCKHVNIICSVNISDGEDFAGTLYCTKCSGSYEVEIKR